MSITPAQIKAARELLGWRRSDLAKRMRVLSASIERIEAGLASTIGVGELRRLFEAAGVEFTRDGGVRLRKGV